MPDPVGLRGDRPGTYREVDFTEVKPARYGNKYLLVFIDTFQDGKKPILQKGLPT